MAEMMMTKQSSFICVSTHSHTAVLISALAICPRAGWRFLIISLSKTPKLFQSTPSYLPRIHKCSLIAKLRALAVFVITYAQTIMLFPLSAGVPITNESVVDAADVGIHAYLLY